MIVNLYNRREIDKAKKEYTKNIGIISDLDDICVVIDELVERIENSELEFKNKYMEELKNTKFDIVSEMRAYEERNLEILEVWEEELEE